MTASPATIPPVVLGARGLTWDEYDAVVYGGARVELADDGGRLDASRRELDRQIAAGARVYAVTTGYGADAGRAIAPDALARVQLNTLRSHAVSVGEEIEQQLVRGMLAAKAQAFAQGPAGVRRVIVERLVELLNRRAHPLVYTQGSQSASGDLIPNAHVGLAVIGEGTVRVGAETLPASEVLGGTLALAPKEGVALTNDVSYATALAFDVVREAARLLERAEVVAAMTLQALCGFPEAFDERLVATRPHPGAVTSARHMRALLAGSELLRDGGRVHDPYSLRCIPQVHGAVRDALAYARASIEVELRCVGDNPLVFPDDGVVLSGGNFHGAPIGLPMDGVATALTTLAALSQRRSHQLVNPAFEVGVPDKLAVDPREQVGLLLANTAAASIVSECASLVSPASVTSIAVDQMEDHVSMAALAGQKARRVLRNLRRVVALELLCAAQALDFQDPSVASAPVRELHAAVRAVVPFAREDGPVALAPLEELL